MLFSTDNYFKSFLQCKSIKSFSTTRYKVKENIFQTKEFCYWNMIGKAFQKLDLLLPFSDQSLLLPDPSLHILRYINIFLQPIFLRILYSSR